jgi:hypothetical protein
MKLVPIDVIVHQVGMVQHVLKQSIIASLNHVIEMELVLIKYEFDFSERNIKKEIILD